jgi:hypothetical protein
LVVDHHGRAIRQAPDGLGDLGRRDFVAPRQHPNEFTKRGHR